MDGPVWTIEAVQLHGIERLFQRVDQLRRLHAGSIAELELHHRSACASWSGLNLHCAIALSRDRAQPLHELEQVQLVPMLDEPAVAHAPDIDAAHPY